MEDSPATPFQISTMGSTPNIESRKLVSKTVKFVDPKDSITIKVKSKIKRSDKPLVISTKSSWPSFVGPLIITTKKLNALSSKFLGCMKACASHHKVMSKRQDPLMMRRHLNHIRINHICCGFQILLCQAFENQ